MEYNDYTDLSEIKVSIMQLYDEKTAERMVKVLGEVFGIRYNLNDPYEVLTQFSFNYGLTPEELSFLKTSKTKLNLMRNKYLYHKDVDKITDFRDFIEFMNEIYPAYQKYVMYDVIDNVTEKIEKGEIEPLDETSRSILSYFFMISYLILMFVIGLTIGLILLR